MQDVVFENEQKISLRTSARVVDLLKQRNVFIGSKDPLPVNQDLIIEIPKSARLEEYCAFPVARKLYTIGAFSYSQSPEPNLIVGRYCSIAHGVSVLGERHPIERVTSSSFTYHFKAGLDKPAFAAAHRHLLANAFEPRYPANRFGPAPVLSHDVWIGQGVQIARGVIIGVGAVVGAGSVVTKNIEPYAIVGGVPARNIRLRFSERVVVALLELKWWQIHPKVLFSCNIDNPQQFVHEMLAAAKDGPLQQLDVRIATWRDFKPEQPD